MALESGVSDAVHQSLPYRACPWSVGGGASLSLLLGIPQTKARYRGTAGARENGAVEDAQ